MVSEDDLEELEPETDRTIEVDGFCDPAAVDGEDREKTVRKGLEEGKLKFRLDGVKLHGWWQLVRKATAEESDSGKGQWLLMKKDNEAAHARPSTTQTGLWLEDLQEAD